MALLPWGKVDVGTNEFSAKRRELKCRDLKYIGIDEHKEAIMIAVQNTGGHLVMESMVETTC